MNLAEQVYQTIKPLPEPMVQEILDFALFLRQREEQAEWQNFMNAQTCSLAGWDNIEDEVWNNVPAMRTLHTQLFNFNKFLAIGSSVGYASRTF